MLSRAANNHGVGGQAVYALEKEESRPRLDPALYGPRTRWTDIGLFQFGFEWKLAGLSIIDALRTTLFPAVIFAIMSSCAFFSLSSGTGQTTSFALLNAG